MVTDQVDLSPEGLILVAKAFKLARSLKTLELRKEKMELRAEIESLDVAEELERIEKELANLKSQQQDPSPSTQLLLEFIQKKTTLETRLEKLRQKRGEIQESVYKSLETEYLEEKQAIGQQLSEIRNQLQKIAHDAADGRQSLTYALEELEVRKDIEGIPEAEFQKRRDELKKELAQSEALQEATTVLLEQVES